MINFASKQLTLTVAIGLSLWLAVMVWPVLAANQPTLQPAWLPPASPESGWQSFSPTPTTWLTASMVTASVQITDSAGLSLTTAVYRYSADNGLTWGDWHTVSTSSAVSTSAVLATPLLNLPDGLTHTFQFAISDTADLPVNNLSPTYTLWVDAAPPTSAILYPPDGLEIQTDADELVITGTAVDATSGVSRVEISADAGQSWATAEGGATWAYTWTVPIANHVSYTFHVRAVDTAGNLQSTPVTAAVTVNRPYYVFLPIALKGPTDTFEPNDTAQTAYGPINSGDIYESYIWSVVDQWDCYYFEPKALGLVNISLSSIPTSGDYDLYLFDSTTIYALAYSQKRGNANEQVVHNLTKLVRNYACVYRYIGYSSTDSYLLQVTYP